MESKGVVTRINNMYVFVWNRIGEREKRTRGEDHYRYIYTERERRSDAFCYITVSKPGGGGGGVTDHPVLSLLTR